MMAYTPDAHHSTRWYSWLGRFQEAAKSSGRVSGIPCRREDEESLARTVTRVGQQNGTAGSVERLAQWPGYVQVVFADRASQASAH